MVDKENRKIVFSFLLLFLFSSTSLAQIAAAGWCVVTDSKDSRSQLSEQPEEPPDDSFPPQDDEQSTSLGCDIGIGFLFYQYKHLGLVGVIGSKSLGPGIAWIINPDARSEIDHRPVMAIAVGITTPYDEDGIYQDIRLTLGMTLSLRQRE